jgi:hypothetical protein
VATGNTLLTVAHALLSDPAADHHDLGADYYEARSQHHRQVAIHVRGLQRLGYRVTLQPIEDAARARGGPHGRPTNELRDFVPSGALPRTRSRAPKRVLRLQVIFGPDNSFQFLEELALAASASLPLTDAEHRFA